MIKDVHINNLTSLSEWEGSRAGHGISEARQIGLIADFLFTARLRPQNRRE
jgi:hypothetical protein